MAQQRSNRKSSRTRTRKQPELRTGGGRQAKSVRSAERAARHERSLPRGPRVSIRPESAGGVATMHLVAYLGVVVVAVVGLLLKRWNVMGYPDTAWMYVAFGMLAAAPAVGRVSRFRTDADGWGLQALLVPLMLLVIEWIAGPACAAGGDCAAVGARGSLGMVGSVLVVALLAACSWGIARFMFDRGEDDRAGNVRSDVNLTTRTMVVLLATIGALLALVCIAVDMTTRETPAYAQRVRDIVSEDCWGLAKAPALDVRPAPDAFYSNWVTYAVRRASEQRPGVDGKKLASNWASGSRVSPYEAVVSLDRDGNEVQGDCRRVGPGSGNASKQDLVEPSADQNPMSPKTTGSEVLPRFFTQGQAGPSAEGVKLAQREAKQRAAAAKKTPTSTSKSATSTTK